MNPGLSFSSLNPIYTQEDLKDIQAMELNRFSSLVGITGQVLSSGNFFYSESPRNEQEFVKQYDNISPVLVW